VVLYVPDHEPARIRSVLWKPNEASDFRGRQAWGKRVAYQSQFNDADDLVSGSSVVWNGSCIWYMVVIFYGCDHNFTFGLLEERSEVACPETDGTSLCRLEHW
jgi:hypothetical protein